VLLAHTVQEAQGGFLKAALGLRIGLSPEEKGWGQPHYNGPVGVKGQFTSGVQGKPPGGGWGHQGGYMRHLKILGVNLYLGGPKPHHHYKPQHGLTLYGGGSGHGHPKPLNFGGGSPHLHGKQHGGGHDGGWSGNTPVVKYQPHQFESNPGSQGPSGTIDYSQNEIHVIDGQGSPQQQIGGYATNIVGKVFSPVKSQQNNNIVYIPAASQVIANIK
jgi:hypothetical protein